MTWVKLHYVLRREQQCGAVEELLGTIHLQVLFWEGMYTRHEFFQARKATALNQLEKHNN